MAKSPDEKFTSHSNQRQGGHDLHRRHRRLFRAGHRSGHDHRDRQSQQQLNRL